MAAIAFDPLEYTHELEASGVPREQAEVHARAMTANFIHNLDALVTRDYLDTRFTEFETRVEANMDRRFSEMQSSVDKCFTEMQLGVDKRFTEMQLGVDKRYTEIQFGMNDRFAKMGKCITSMESNMDMRFVKVEAKIEKLSDAIELRFERMEGKFSRIHLMFGLTMVTATIPILQNFFGG
jgi:hypothetical protein